ncbi:MAG: PaaI family thioesterase, partial [Acidobacteria bacterium]|nr:PaaI family thioesterase [Acidobacteriota bacterium]
QGIVHGGVIAALLDTAATLAFLTAAAPGEDVTTIEFKVNFLSPVVPRAPGDPGGEAGIGGEAVVRAEATEIHHGRRTRTAEARLLSPRRSSDARGSERTAATGLFTALVLEK